MNLEFANLLDGGEGFDDYESFNDRGVLYPKYWWLVHGGHAPFFQKIAFKVLGIHLNLLVVKEIGAPTLLCISLKGTR